MGIPCRYKVVFDSKEFFLWTTADRVEGVFEKYGFGERFDLMDHGDFTGVLYSSRKDWNSLVLECERGDDVRKCIDFLGLGLDLGNFLNAYNLGV